MTFFTEVISSGQLLVPEADIIKAVNTGTIGEVSRTMGGTIFTDF